MWAFDAAKMAQLVAFVFDPVCLNGDLKAAWEEILDRTYVEVMKL